MASPSTRESFELVDFHPTGRPTVATAPDSASARAHRSPRAAGPFEPAANSQSLAGLESGPDTEWEKTAPPEHPRAFRSTRLRFWAEALRRRAQRSLRTGVDRDSEPPAKMKFSHSIQFNAVPDWSTNYIAYSNLKKL